MIGPRFQRNPETTGTLHRIGNQAGSRNMHLPINKETQTWEHDNGRYYQGSDGAVCFDIHKMHQTFQPLVKTQYQQSRICLK